MVMVLLHMRHTEAEVELVSLSKGASSARIHSVMAGLLFTQTHEDT